MTDKLIIRIAKPRFSQEIVVMRFDDNCSYARELRCDVCGLPLITIDPGDKLEVTLHVEESYVYFFEAQWRVLHIRDLNRTVPSQSSQVGLTGANPAPASSAVARPVTPMAPFELPQHRALIATSDPITWNNK